MIVPHHSEIARRYVAGQSTSDIARELNIRPSEVIGYIRTSKLQPPGMGVRYVPANDGAAAAESAAVPPSTEAAQPRPCRPAEPGKALPARSQINRTRAVEQARLSGSAAATHRPTPPDDTTTASESTSPASRSDEDWDDDEPPRRRGCPPGWLVSEAEYDAAFRRSGGRFEDVVFKQKRC
jgi:hypothetical protein